MVGKIDKKSIEQVWKLGENSEVFVLCSISICAKDPTENSEIISAKKMIGPNKLEVEIPSKIKTTYAKDKHYQAYVVDEYVIFEEPFEFNFGGYVSLMANDCTKPFSERFKLKQFQNTFGRFDSSIKDVFIKRISVKMKLKYPYVVNIK